MSWSLGEVQALAIKATRGAKFPPGLAEEAGVSVRWLAARSLPGVEALAAYLTVSENIPRSQIPDAFWLTGNEGGAPYCPLALGAALTDHATSIADLRQITLGTVLQPLLLAPFAVSLARVQPFVLEWPGVRLALSPCALDSGVDAPSLITGKAKCALLADAVTSARLLSTATRVPSQSLPHIETLEKLAARTYAPATEASRLAGAGAGTRDND